MRAAGAALIGAAAVAAAVALASRANASEETPDDGVDFDIDAEVQLASNYYANAITRPETWNPGQLLSLEGLLVDLGLTPEAANIHDMRIGLYGDAIPTPLPLPDLNFIPQTELDAIAAVEDQIAP